MNQLQRVRRDGGEASFARGGAQLGPLLEELATLRAEIVAEPAGQRRRLAEVHANYGESARNLLHYLALRRRDLRPLQLRLAGLGLSSLGRAESHVLATVDTVMDVVKRLAKPRTRTLPPQADLDFQMGQRLLVEHTDALLGPASPGRSVRIMVTMPSEAADDYTLVHDLLKQGMDCMRINCAHDDANAWLRMVRHLRRAERALGRSCRIVMDLAGPKLRTGPLEPGPAVLRARPRRDVYGRVTAPARIWLTSDFAQAAPGEADACLTVAADWLAALQLGERVKFRDARDAKRSFTVVDVTDRGCWVEMTRTAYFVPGTMLHRRKTTEEQQRSTGVGNLPARENAIPLLKGDLLVLTRGLAPGRPATVDSAGRILTPASIGCTIPELFDDLHVRHAPCWACWEGPSSHAHVHERQSNARARTPGSRRLRSGRAFRPRSGPVRAAPDLRSGRPARGGQSARQVRGDRACSPGRTLAALDQHGAGVPEP
jgi:pyruvate kinase